MGGTSTGGSAAGFLHGTVLGAGISPFMLGNVCALEPDAFKIVCVLGMLLGTCWGKNEGEQEKRPKESD